MQVFIDKLLGNPSIGKLLLTIGGIIVIHIVVLLIRRSTGRYITDPDIRYKTRKFTSFMGFLLAVMVIAMVYSDRLGGLNIALGVAGAGIAFALQEVIASIAGWFTISFSRFYKTGDRVQVGGIKGDVIDIGVLRTTIMEIGDWVKGDLYNGRVVRVANSFVFKEPVYNYSGDFPFLWDEITIPIKYGSDYQLARQVISQIVEKVVAEYSAQAQLDWDQLVKKFRIEKARILPLVSLTADENWLTYTARYVVDYKSRRTIKDELFTKILEAIVEHQDKIVIASSSLEINVKNT